MPDRNNELWVFIEGEPAGLAVRSHRGTVHFAYHEQRSLSEIPLSLSVLPAQRFLADISEWIDGLLPDNDTTRASWAQHLGAPTTEPFDLLSTSAGLECAGAVQFSSTAALPDDSSGTLQRFSDTEIAKALRLLRQDEWLGSEPVRGLRLSLPGAQPKTALCRTDSIWHMPTGTLATSHILKPQQAHLNASVRSSIAVNEHLCQKAASELGLNAAATTLESFDGEVCLVSQRFDRHVVDGQLRRVHFEDMCQALGVAPRFRYQADGGPTPETILALLRSHGQIGAERPFFLASFYNWLIGNTDAHSKNYGILLGGGNPRLAPLYDLSSSVPYSASQTMMQPAMQFEGLPGTVSEWGATADRLRVGIKVDELVNMVIRLPEAFEAALACCPAWATEQAQSLAEQIVKHAVRAK